ncbi:MAG: DedA family protein, partial [Streptomyces sp.]|nr:DedA family protein [Streptomyces sp.]NUS28144.1 DedA family protein [Streptomyces sp.]
FLPGDSLLFTAGLLCTGSADRGLKLSLAPLLVAAAVGALAGAQCGYLVGRRAGGALLARSSSQRLHQGAGRAQELLERYGHAKAIVLARFVPVVRTVLNPMAGALRVPVRTFTLWQMVGGLAWSLGLTLAGYALGSSVPNVDRYLLPMVAVIVALSLIPFAAELLRSRRDTKTKEARG